MNLENYFSKSSLFDPVLRAVRTNNCFLRSYQSEALRTIYDAVMEGTGGRFTVTFPRQSGKNETQAQLEAAVMAASQWKGGSIIKIIPTEKNQGKIRTSTAGIPTRSSSTTPASAPCSATS